MAVKEKEVNKKLDMSLDDLVEKQKRARGGKGGKGQNKDSSRGNSNQPVQKKQGGGKKSNKLPADISSKLDMSLDEVAKRSKARSRSRDDNTKGRRGNGHKADDKSRSDGKTKRLPRSAHPVNAAAHAGYVHPGYGYPYGYPSHHHPVPHGYPAPHPVYGHPPRGPAGYPPPHGHSPYHPHPPHHGQPYRPPHGSHPSHHGQPPHASHASQQALRNDPHHGAAANAGVESTPVKRGFQVSLSNVPPELKAKDLAEAFVSVSSARVESVDVLRDARGQPTGEAFVIFTTYQDAQNAVNRYHGGDLNGRRLQVVYQGEVVPH